MTDIKTTPAPAPGLDLEAIERASPPVLATSQRRCRSCIHPAHLGTCTGRSGGTAYACGCSVVTLADDPEYGKPPPAVEPPEPCLDCERAPCACANALHAAADAAEES